MSHSSAGSGTAGSITVPGVVVRGHGVASGIAHDSPFPAGTIELQLPHFLARGLDLRDLHPATVNVDIAPHTYRVITATHTFTDIRWTDVHGSETFSFIEGDLTRVQAGRHVGGHGSSDRWQGWIYYPHPETKPMHEQPATVLELLLPLIPGLAYGDEVVLSLDPEQIEIS